MQYVSSAFTPLGEVLLASDGEALTGLWFRGQKYFARTLDTARSGRYLFLNGQISGSTVISPGENRISPSR